MIVTLIANPAVDPNASKKRPIIKNENESVGDEKILNNDPSVAIKIPTYNANALNNMSEMISGFLPGKRNNVSNLFSALILAHSLSHHLKLQKVWMYSDTISIIIFFKTFIYWDRF